MLRYLSALFLYVLSSIPYDGANGTESGLYARPVLMVDPRIHTAPIFAAAVDVTNQIGVTASFDKTVRVWNLANGDLIQTIYVPQGHGQIGKMFSVAIDPTGEVIAAGGWTRWSDKDPQDQIYFFEISSGEMVGRIDNLANTVQDLRFSPDGKRLAAVTFAGGGFYLFEHRKEDWILIKNNWFLPVVRAVDFAPDGRIAVASYDGSVHLYDADGTELAIYETLLGTPAGLAFSPDGQTLAVGLLDTNSLLLLDTASLKPLPSPVLPELQVTDDNQAGLTRVAWSSDGETLFAGGYYSAESGSRAVLAWSNGGTGAKREIEIPVKDTIMGIVALSSGDLLVAGQDPWLGRIAEDGTVRWKHEPIQANHSSERLSASHDGMMVDFNYGYGVEGRVRFDVEALALKLDPPSDGLTFPAVQDTLAISGWDRTRDPAIDGLPLYLAHREQSLSLAIHPDGDRFILGADFNLYAFDAAGSLLWRRPTPNFAWAVNVTRDGRYAVAGYGDGTIRWHRMEDGNEVLVLFPFNDGRNWAVWEPDGRFASTLGARSTLRWLHNKGWDAVPVVVAANQIQKSFRPEVIKRVLPQGGTMEAVYAAEETERRRDIMRLTGSDNAPGAQLHVLTVGISTYGERARRISLDWADEDARDLHAALSTQTEDLWPYQPGFSMVLQNAEATSLNIRTQLDNIIERMKSAPTKNDLAVIHFSSHGVVVGEGEDREFYLLPHDADLGSPSRIEDSGLSAKDLRGKMAAMANHGRVLLLLDACRSGAAGPIDAEALRRNLAGRNVTVLTSSRAEEPSWEKREWRNGAFTEVLLEALGKAGDTNGNGLVSIDELVGYVDRNVRSLTEGRQTPTVEQRFLGEIFASGL